MTRTIVCTHLGFRANTMIATEVAEITKKVRDYTLGAALILGAEPDRYSNIIRGLKNASLLGRDEWPTTVTEAYNYLSKWEGDDTSAHAARGFKGVAFANDTSKPQPATREPKPWYSTREPKPWYSKNDMPQV
jgi:hypothetical protein